MTLHAIIALGAGAVIVAMLAIAFVTPNDDGTPKTQVRPSRSGRKLTSGRRRAMPALRRAIRTETPPAARAREQRPSLRSARHGFARAWRSAVRGVQEQVRRFLVLLEADRRNVRRFRKKHPETDVLLLTCFVSVLLGALIAQL